MIKTSLIQAYLDKNQPKALETLTSKSNVSVSTIRNILKGSDTSTKTISKLAAAMNVNPADLINENPKPVKSKDKMLKSKGQK